MYESEIYKLFDAMGTDFGAIASEMIEAMIGSMIESIQEEIPDATIPESFWDKYRKNPDTESLRSLYVAIYNRRYTREDIIRLITFHESPLGRKLDQANSQLTKEIETISAAYFESIQKEILAELIEEEES
jgi:hypothetical protein